MRPTLGGGGVSCRRVLSERFINQALNHQFTALTLTPTTTLLTKTTPSSWTCPTCSHLLPRITTRSSSSNSQWKSRQTRDRYAQAAKVQGLKSRAAFKLLEMDAKYRLFKRNQTVVDLGYAPGSWSQVALERTRPHGLVVGIDLIPAQPPRGVTSIQGDFLSPHVQKLVKDVLLEQVRRKKRETTERKPLEKERHAAAAEEGEGEEGKKKSDGVVVGEKEGKEDEEVVIGDRPSYIDMEKIASHEIEAAEAESDSGRIADLVISDMSEPWAQTTGFMSNTLSRPYRRLMNTSGITFKDHAGSMDLCYAALSFASDTLKTNGHFICKFYQGAEDKVLHTKLKKMFHTVHREKPDSSRKDSKEAFFVALRRKGNVTLADIE